MRDENCIFRKDVEQWERDAAAHNQTFEIMLDPSFCYDREAVSSILKQPLKRCHYVGSISVRRRSRLELGIEQAQLPQLNEDEIVCVV